MGVAISLVLLAVGAILAIATRLQLAGIDLRPCGWVLMVAGVMGLLFTFSPARSRTRSRRSRPSFGGDERYPAPRRREAP
jgi:hypothetical protein